MVTDMLKGIFHSIFIVVVALAGCVTQSNDTHDVDRFIQRRALCDHFRGELPDPSEKARMDEVIKKANEACAGTDAQLKALRAKYAARCGNHEETASVRGRSGMTTRTVGFLNWQDFQNSQDEGPC